MCFFSKTRQAHSFFNACRNADYTEFVYLHPRSDSTFDPRYPKGKIPAKLLKSSYTSYMAGITGLIHAIISNGIDIAAELAQNEGNIATYSEMVLEPGLQNTLLKFHKIRAALDQSEPPESVIIIPAYTTPLMLAIILGRDEIVRHLFQGNNYAVGMKNEEGYCALDYLMISGRNHLLDVAIDTNSQFLNIELCRSSLYVKMAIYAGNFSIMEYFHGMCLRSKEFKDTFGALFAVSKAESLTNALIAQADNTLVYAQGQVLTSEQESLVSMWLNNMKNVYQIITKIARLLSGQFEFNNSQQIYTSPSRVELGGLKHQSSVFTAIMVSTGSRNSTGSKLRLNDAVGEVLQTQ